MPIVFRSKIDVWIILIALFMITVSTITCFWAVGEGGMKMWITLFSAGGFGIVLPIWAFASTRYTLDRRYLSIKSGPFNWEVPLSAITDITPTSNPLSSPALSLDRLKITHRDGTVMISPDDHESFIRHLEAYRSIGDRMQ